jgi:drug/metabolite transporter (DMT)-like permease
MMAASVGAFLFLGTTNVWLAATFLLLGVAGVLFGLKQSGKRLRVTQFNPHPWRWPDSAVLGLGVGVLVLAAVSSNLDYAAMNTSTAPLAWPQLTLGMIAILALTAAVLLPTAPVRIDQRQAAELIGARRSLRPRADLVAAPVTVGQGAR